MLANNSKPTSGTCDCCPNVSENLVERTGMMMCEKCAADQDAAVSTQVIQTAHATDMLVQSKSDILAAQTTAMSVIKAAIWNDATIPEAKRQFVYAEAVQERFTHFQKMLFEQRQQISETEKVVKEWQKNVQLEVGRLAVEERAKFSGMDVSYQPAKPKTVKAAKTGTPKKSTKQIMEEVYAAAKKYGVPAPAVSMMASARNMTPEDCAKDIAARLAANKSATQ